MRDVKILQKWNYKNQAYEPYEVPDDWNVKSYSGDMDEMRWVVNAMTQRG